MDAAYFRAFRIGHCVAALSCGRNVADICTVRRRRTGSPRYATCARISGSSHNRARTRIPSLQSIRPRVSRSRRCCKRYANETTSLSPTAKENSPARSCALARWAITRTQNSKRRSTPSCARRTRLHVMSPEVRHNEGPRKPRNRRQYRVVDLLIVRREIRRKLRTVQIVADIARERKEERDKEHEPKQHRAFAKTDRRAAERIA